ncbi:DUF1254 domain-containing protein [Streptomyces sp. Go40/10]|uniref:DUF1254 domain-containing protein n=1 Tax=Streptomyces sp. Go40/10 TaxID=2825844 RepID=UPI001E32269D|nr:DUF1254 domain-containing protein [Streptomyces sp. Go40/10]UFR00125.1 DUF1254 domain-containing protein [Streptomyces sp. Go40/10]
MTKLADDLRTLSREAYVYLYPLVTMDVTRERCVSVPAGLQPGSGPPNQFHHIREFPSADFRDVVRPNFDTLYSAAWLDLTHGPVDVSVQDTEDRYFLLPMLDMWTDVFAAPGKRTTGTGAQRYTLVMNGDQVADAQDATIIQAPTPYVWVIGRTQTNGPDDYKFVNAVQDGYTVTPRTPAPGETEQRSEPAAEEPLSFVNGLSAVEFFHRGAELLRLHPPHATDFSVLARIAGLGLVPGRPFTDSGFAPEQLREIQAGVDEARQQMLAARTSLGRQLNGWAVVTENIGVYGNNYFQRAVVSMVGLGANQPEDAVYPVLGADADGEPLVGERDYVLHFDADAMPPVSAFWSVTMYDATGFPAPNELNRFALGDRDRLGYNGDGSLDILISHAHPGAEREANWLPAPTGPLGVTLRLYAPRPEVLSGCWAPPAVRRS